MFFDKISSHSKITSLLSIDTTHSCGISRSAEYGKRFIAFSLLLMFVPSIVAAQSKEELPACAIQYLAAFDEVRSIEYDFEMLHVSGDLVIPGRSVLESDVNGKSVETGHMKSLVGVGEFVCDSTKNDEFGKVTNAYSQGKRFAYVYNRNEGGIFRDMRTWPRSLSRGLGEFIYCDFNQKPDSVKSIIENHLYAGSITEIGPSKFRIERIYGKPGDPLRYDLEIEVSEEFGYQPTRIELWFRGEVSDPSNQHLKQTLFRAISCYNFRQYRNVWLPTLLRWDPQTPDAQSLVLKANPETIVVNQDLARVLNYQLPKGTRYHDQFLGKTFRADGTEDKALVVKGKKKTEQRKLVVENSSHWKWPVLIGALALALVTACIWISKRRSAVMVLFALCFLPGCSGNRADGPTSSAELPLLTPTQSLPLVVKFPKSKKDGGLEIRIPFVNRSELSLNMSDVETSCDGASAKWDKGVVAPNAKVECIALVERPDNQRKSIALKSKLKTPQNKDFEFEFSFEVIAEANRAWFCRENALMMECVLGDVPRGSLYIEHLAKQHLDCPKLKSEIVSVIENETTDLTEITTKLSFVGNSTCDEVGSHLLGQFDLSFFDEDEDRISFPVNVRVQPPVKWSVPAIVLPIGLSKEVSVSSVDNWQITEVSASNSTIEIVKSVEPPDHWLVSSQKDSETGRATVIAKATNGRLIYEAILPVLTKRGE